MRLMLHVGMNKAGSTYFQDLLSFNVTHLMDKGIYYPNPEVSDGASGVQAGNAKGLSKALAETDVAQTMEYLRPLIAQAAEGGADRLCLSSEFLFRRIVRKKQFETLKAACKELGVNRPQILVIFREPADHAISAYTHRAAKMPDFDYWVSEAAKIDKENAKPGNDYYEFWTDLDLFLRNVVGDPDIDLICKSLSIGIGPIAAQFVGVSDLSPLPFDQSNVSINCVEAELFRHFVAQGKNYHSKLRGVLRSIPKSDKAPDTEVRERFREIARRHMVASHNNNVRKLAELTGDHSIYTEPTLAEVATGKTTVFPLSPSQINAITEALIA